LKVIILTHAIKRMTLVLLMALIFVSMINISTNFEQVGTHEEQLRQLEQSAASWTETISQDQMRQKVVSKIITIIDAYNRKLSDKEKTAIAHEIYRMSLKYDNLDVDLICATITHESARTWRPNVVSPVGALGLMQIMPYTGMFLSEMEGVQWTTAEDILCEPITNVRLGCRYLSMLIARYHVDGGLAAYNGGERRATRWLASGRDDKYLAKETRGYIPAVLKLYDRFRN